MRPIRRPALGVLACAAASLGLSGPVAAQALGDPDWFTITPSFENFEDEEGNVSCTFRLRGEAPRFPDGTSLRVRLALPGDLRQQQATTFRTTVGDHRFAAEQSWSGRTIAPGNYLITVQLLVEKQPPAVRRHVMREFGYTANHVESLADEVVTNGTAEERADFLRDSLEEALGMLADAEELAGRAQGILAEAPDPVTPEWSEQVEGIKADVDVLQKRVVASQRSYVLRSTDGLLDRIVGHVSTVYRSARAAERGYDGSSMLRQIEEQIRQTRQMIRSRLPFNELDEDEEESE